MAILKKGDAVSWNTPQGETHGTVTKKITSDKTIDGYTANASKDNPQYEVESDKTGKRAVHKSNSLSRK